MKTFPDFPKQKKGDFHEIVSMKTSPNISIAKSNYSELYKRLKAINNWESFSDKVKASFYLVDAKTLKITTTFKTGNFVKIDIPGPGNPSGNGFDWTDIINVQESKENDDYPFLTFTLKPCKSPENSKDVVAHFFDDESTNTFVVRRMGTYLFAEVHGRNQQKNIKDIPLKDTIRNAAILMGNTIGLAGLNWLGLTDALLQPFALEE
ncbi:hypothetical protein ULMS_13900 [Patiriisocius marinistellae]|uniref:Uncharacterized protein n=1 Tax=Patiriisocius marinistellae TaxID=2494560 RepID=A0A5J4FXJ9_9FLAO|nr:hypothetical protein [Patiriisocius marinistellae]GEQ85882.1 hypothetical protein ULMS_13900 [Patiriisocius marinistellae]